MKVIKMIKYTNKPSQNQKMNSNWLRVQLKKRIEKFKPSIRILKIKNPKFKSLKMTIKMNLMF